MTMSLSGMFPIEQSDLYHLLMEEKMHIEKNKYFLSERMGFDVGIEYAKYNWNMCHRKKWWDQATGKKL
jgi:hypothetical protein